MEESSMNKNTKSNQKCTWAVLPPISLSFCAFFFKISLFLLFPFFLFPIPTPIRAAPPRKILRMRAFSPTFSKKNLLAEKENPTSFSHFPFFKSSPLQNLPRRVPLSLNSHGKFPCKNMKFLKLNNCMNR